MATVLRSKRSINIGTSPVAVGSYTAPSVATGVFITSLVISNTTSVTIQVTVVISDGVTPGTYIQNSPLLVGGVLELPSTGRPVLNSGDQVLVSSNTANSCSAVLSVSEIT